MHPSTHPTVRSPVHRVSRACLAVAASLAMAAPVWAAGAATAKAPADAAYQRDRAACQAMTSAPERTAAQGRHAVALTARTRAQCLAALPGAAPRAAGDL
jgi:hypothetical protein